MVHSRETVAVHAEIAFRVVGPDDADALADLFDDIDSTFFRPHPFTADEARRIAHDTGKDVYALLYLDARPVVYGMLRGWDEGYATPSLGIATRTDSRRRGLGRRMMQYLHDLARDRGSTEVRLRVHERNMAARHLYKSLGYEYAGVDRGELVMTLDVSAAGAGDADRQTLRGDRVSDPERAR